MKQTTPPGSNQPDNPLTRLLLHGIALAAMALAIYVSLQQGSWVPIALGLLIVLLLEVVWLYLVFKR